MEQYKLNKAYPAMLRLCDFKLSIKKAREIYHATTKMKQHFDFALQEERKCVKEFGGLENLDGSIKFESTVDFGKFQDRMVELNESEVDWDLAPVIIEEDEISDQAISAADILNLEGFVVFK